MHFNPGCLSEISLYRYKTPFQTVVDFHEADTETTQHNLHLDIMNGMSTQAEELLTLHLCQSVSATGGSQVIQWKLR